MRCDYSASPFAPELRDRWSLLVQAAAGAVDQASELPLDWCADDNLDLSDFLIS
jgi:hypothetical protein